MIAIENKTALALCLGGKSFIPCDTFGDASKLFRQYITQNNLGGSDMKRNSGLLYHPTKGAFAHVSYNGRVWKGIDMNWRKGMPQEILDTQTNDL